MSNQLVPPLACSSSVVTTSRLTTLGFPSTAPQSMILSLVNDAPWGNSLAHAEVTNGEWHTRYKRPWAP